MNKGVVLDTAAMSLFLALRSCPLRLSLKDYNDGGSFSIICISDKNVVLTKLGTHP